MLSKVTSKCVKIVGAISMTADGSVRVPEVLRPYLGGAEKLSPA